MAPSAQARLDLDGFSRAVRAVALSPEGNFMAGASNSREIKIWDTMQGDELVTIKGHDGDGLCVCTMDEAGGCRCARHPGTRTDLSGATVAASVLLCIPWPGPSAARPQSLPPCTSSVSCVSKGGVRRRFPPRAHTWGPGPSPPPREGMPRRAKAERQRPPPGRRKVDAACKVSGHSDEVLAIDFSPCGKKLASGATRNPTPL